ncbi:MAG: heparinase II/III family protein [Kineosporiaceae bacterium]
MDRSLGMLFPFVAEDRLLAAADRCAASEPPEACRRLLVNAERILTLPELADPLAQDVGVNLFVAQNVLLEASLAYRLTGQERYLRPVRALLERLTDPGYRADRLPTELHYGFLLVGLGVAERLCGPAVDRDRLSWVAGALGAKLAAAAASATWGEDTPQRNAWNHSVIGFTGLGCAGLLCPDHPDAEAWTATGIDRLGSFFRHGITDAGMTREGLHYAGFVFRNAAPFLLACRATSRFDYRDPGQNPYLARLGKVPAWYAMEVFPGGRWLQNLNDSNWDPRRALGGFLPLFGPLNPQLTGWVYRQLVGVDGDGSHGQAPGLRCCVLFESVLWAEPEPADRPASGDLPDLLFDPDVGYLAEKVRTDPVSAFAVNCGHFVGGIHDQSDNGAVTLAGYGVPLLIDSGAANQPVEGSASSSHGHNVVLIDGRGQHPAGAGIGVSGVMLRVERAPAATMVSLDLTGAYRAQGYHRITHAVRHCVYGKHPVPYLLLVDDVGGPQGAPAAFEQLFHTPPATRSRPDNADEVELLIDVDGAHAGLVLHPLDCAPVTSRTWVGGGLPWLEHPVWAFRREGRHEVMATLALPFREGERTRLSARVDARAGRVRLRWQGDGQAEEGEVLVDELRFRPGARSPARFTRDGVALPQVEVLLARRPPAARSRRRRSAALARRLLRRVWRRLRFLSRASESRVS